MLNASSLHAVDNSHQGQHFRKPLYDSYCFSQIPATIARLLTKDGAQFGVGLSSTGLPDDVLSHLRRDYDTVILFFVDAFGWRFVKPRLETASFLKRIARDGVVSKLTSQFPSTTAAHVTAIHTGMAPNQSGIYEWFYYEPQLDAIIAPLLFSFAGDRQRNTLLRAGARPDSLFPKGTFYPDLADHGVRSFVLSDGDYAHSPFSEVLCRGANIVPYRTLPEALINLRQLIAEQKGKAYYHLYFDRIDTTGHIYGPDSPYINAEIEAFLATMETLFQGMLAPRLKRTLFLMTADHGQTAVDPATTFYINKEMPALLPWLQSDGMGSPIVPAGSARDMFLHVRAEHLEDARALLEEKLAGRAEVHRVADLIEAGFFGLGTPSPAFLGRVGNLVILPYSGESVWWLERGRFQQNLRGAHGGLTPDEMDTVLLALAYE